MADFGDAFMQGSQDAQNFALKKSDLELKRQELEGHMAAQRATSEQHKIQTTMKLMDDWTKVAQLTPNSPLQKVGIKKIQMGMAQLGLPRDLELEAAVTDDNGRQEFFKAMGTWNSLSDEMKGQLALKANDLFGTEKGWQAIQWINNQAGELQKIAATGEETRKTNAAKAAIEKPDKQLAQENVLRKDGAEEMNRLRHTPEYQEYVSLSSSAKSILDAVSKSKGKASPFRDVGLLYDFMKLLDPKSVVRESEQDLFRYTGSAFTGIANTLTKLANGQTIGAKAKKELADIVHDRLGRGYERYQLSAESTLASMEEQGIPRNRVDPGSTIIKKDKALVESYRKRFDTERIAEEKANSGTLLANRVEGSYAPSVLGNAKRLKALAEKTGKTLDQVNSDLKAAGKPPIPDDLAKYIGF